MASIATMPFGMATRSEGSSPSGAVAGGMTGGMTGGMGVGSFMDQCGGWLMIQNLEHGPEDVFIKASVEWRGAQKFDRQIGRPPVATDNPRTLAPEKAITAQPSDYYA